MIREVDLCELIRVAAAAHVHEITLPDGIVIRFAPSETAQVPLNLNSDPGPLISQQLEQEAKGMSESELLISDPEAYERLQMGEDS
jgi:hypothetical protein